MKTGLLGFLGLVLVANAHALTINEPLEFETQVVVPIYNITCLNGPFRMQRLNVKLDTPIGRQGQSGVLLGGFGSPHECGAELQSIAAQAIGGTVALNLKISQQTVLALAPDGTNTCVGGQQEVITTNVGHLTAVEALVDVEEKLDCPAGLNAQWVNHISGVIFILHNNGIPTAPKL